MKHALLILGIMSTLISQAQFPFVQHGRIERIALQSDFVDDRPVDVWLPDNYSADKEYAVLYMHDGQMLYDASITWNKQEWGVDEVVGTMLSEGKLRDCIVVGIWNHSTIRHLEYGPQKAFNYISKAEMDVLLADTTVNRFYPMDSLKADNYLRFMVEELMPEINSRYSVSTGRESTFVAGSSMGGLISMYAICEYPDVFGGAACLSTHWVGLFRAENNPVPDAFLAYFNDHIPDPATHRLYFDHGTATLDSLYAPFQLRANEILSEKGYHEGNSLSLVFEGADHSEIAWKERLHIPLDFLLRKE